jgi:hypothetical protein
MMRILLDFYMIFYLEMYASYVDIRSRANTTRGLDYEHMIKVRAHKGGVRIGKTPKKLASICCP